MSLPEGAFSSSAAELDFGEVTLAEKLKVFKTSDFDPENYVSTRCRTTGQKEIKYLVTGLIDLKKASAEEMRKSVYANYPSFIRTSREISDLEGQLVTLRNLLSNREAIIHTLADGVRVDSMSSGPGSRKRGSFDFEDKEPSKMEIWLSQYIDNLNILLAERRVDEALAALDEGDRVAKEEKSGESMTPSMLSTLKAAITEQRQKLADQLAEFACQPSSSGIELRSSVEIIKRLGDGPRAHTLLLNSHHQKLQSKIQGLQTSGSSYGVAYTAALSQLVFSIIAQASSDSLAIFGDQPLYSSELVTWSIRQTDTFAFLMKRHVIASPSASGGLRTVAECVQISMGHCYLLEARGLALAPVLLRHFRPCVEQALNANLKGIEQSTAARAAADDWSLNFPPVGSRSLGSTVSLGSSIVSQPKLSSSAHRFNVMVQELFVTLNTVASLASDMFVGRERFSTLLLIRLTETVILWLSDEQSFWEEIEHGPKPLGPFGLRQFYLDMQFVILFASQRRYLSRNMHQVIKNIISRAMDSVAAANIDPYSTLPEDEWFADVAQTAIKMLSGTATFENEAASPIASMSARSVSSVSHVE